ncbi:HD domain-containing protein [Virgibacillus halophilus]|uniref:HD domain-containing protein n=1 Tax=Tigheibacillus halophilus TaxID=361280 RepID=A0ABU5CB92_9BACI|nr:HD domain-containing protein [Virgibacillus halophilus]
MSKKKFSTDAGGHDFYHMQRVAKLAKAIACKEHADVFVTEAAAWLHDVGDHKLFPDPERALEEMNQYLYTLDMAEEQISLINQIIAEISYSKGVRIPDSIEAKIVQDADKLDAIGAVGIARTFAYGGSKGQLMYDSAYPENTSFQHFYDKLFNLKKMMHTTYAKQLAAERHKFLEIFAKQFLHEWDTEQI